VDQGQFQQLQRVPLRAVQDLPRIEHPVGIELHPSLPYGKGQVEHAARGQERRQAFESAFKARRIHRIPIAAQAEVFQGVQARKRVAAAQQLIHGIHEVGLLEQHPRDGLLDGPDVEDLHLAEAGHMGHQAVHPGSDIHVPHGLGLEYFPGDQQILPKVFRIHVPALVEPIMDAQQKIEAAAVASPEFEVVPDEPGEAP
jgi:hypothetical protein